MMTTTQIIILLLNLFTIAASIFVIVYVLKTLRTLRQIKKDWEKSNGR